MREAVSHADGIQLADKEMQRGKLIHSREEKEGFTPHSRDQTLHSTALTSPVGRHQLVGRLFGSSGNKGSVPSGSALLSPLLPAVILRLLTRPITASLGGAILTLRQLCLLTGSLHPYTVPPAVESTFSPPPRLRPASPTGKSLSRNTCGLMLRNAAGSAWIKPQMCGSPKLAGEEVLN